MSTTAAFALKANYELDSVGAIAVGDDSVNVRELLEDGDGFIEADSPAVIAALDAYAPLKRVTATEVERARKKPAAKPAAPKPNQEG